MRVAMLPVAILAGGLATRLRPLTETIPKSLVPVAGEPFLAHQLRLLARSGIRRVVLCIGHLGEAIRRFAGDGSRFDLTIQYSEDGPVLLGTAGAVRRALPWLGEEFFVLYGDSYLPCDYRAVAEAFRRARRPALMTVYRNEGQGDASNVDYQNGEILAYDKRRPTARMHYIDYGLGVFSRSVFERLPPETPYDLAELYQELLARRELAAFEASQRFYHVGSFEAIAELEQYLLTHQESERP